MKTITEKRNELLAALTAALDAAPDEERNRLADALARYQEATATSAGQRPALLDAVAHGVGADELAERDR